MSDELRRTLESAGRAEAPAPDPTFVRELEARLAGGAHVAAVPRARRPFLPAAAAVVVVAAGVGLAIGLSHDDSPVDQVRTEPNPSVTTSTLLDAPTTTVLLPPVTPLTDPTTSTSSTTPTTPTTIRRAVVPTPTTTTPRATTTTTVAPTTTTAPPAFQDLHLTCTTDAVNTRISCAWDASTNPAFASFRLTRRTHDGPENVVYTGTAHEFSERSGTGARWVYLVTALDAAGRSLGSSTVDVTCC